MPTNKNQSPFNRRLRSLRRAWCAALLLSAFCFLAVSNAQAQLTLNRYISSGTTITWDPSLGGYGISTLNWTNNGFTNISSVSVTIDLSAASPPDFWVGGTAAFLDYNAGAVQADVYTYDPLDTSDSLNATFTLTDSFTSPMVTNEWSLTFDNLPDPDQIGEGTLNYWRLIVTGGAVTNGTISVGQQGIISASAGYTVSGAAIAATGTGANGITVTNSAALTFNGGLTGSGDLNKVGSGALSIGGNSSGFSGSVLLNEGSVNLTTNTALGSGRLIQSNGSSTVIFSGGGTYANNMSLYNVSFTSGGNILSGTITNNNTTYNVSAGVTNTLSGLLTGSGGVTKDGTGALVIAGSANNDYTGATVVNGGSLVLSNSSGNAINSSSSIKVNSGGTLVLGASNQIGDGIGLTLDGGTLLVGAANVTEDLGTLTLNASSIIDFGNFGAAGFRQLTFDNSSGITWTGTLTITNWQGVANTSSEFTELVFGVGGLNTNQLGQIYFATQGVTGGALLGTGELVPVPEPRVYVAAIALLGFVGWRERKRIASLFVSSRKS